MLDTLNIPKLKQRRKALKMCFMHKLVGTNAHNQNQYTYPSIAISEKRSSQRPGAALKVLQGLSLEMWNDVTPRYHLA